MADDYLAPERHTMPVGAKRHFAFSFDKDLESSDTLTGTPTVTEVGSNDLSITGKAVSSDELTISKRTVAAGRAVQFTVQGQVVANQPYTLKISCATTNGETVVGKIEIPVKA